MILQHVYFLSRVSFVRKRVIHVSMLWNLKFCDFKGSYLDSLWCRRVLIKCTFLQFPHPPKQRSTPLLWRVIIERVSILYLSHIMWTSVISVLQFPAQMLFKKLCFSDSWSENGESGSFTLFVLCVSLMF